MHVRNCEVTAYLDRSTTWVAKYWAWCDHAHRDAYLVLAGLNLAARTSRRCTCTSRGGGLEDHAFLAGARRCRSLTEDVGGAVVESEGVDHLALARGCERVAASGAEGRALGELGNSACS